MYPGAIQLLSVGLFAACLYHSWHNEGKKYAQQWFAIGYLFALLQQVVLVQLGMISYSDRILQFGSAPTITSLLLPALFYISYVAAGRIIPADNAGPMLLVIFLLTPTLALPVDASALAFDWWSFPAQSSRFLNGIPYFVPLSWGLTGALFYAFIRFVRRIRFRGSGQLFALILGTPLIAGISLLLIMLGQLVVALLNLVQGDLLLKIFLGMLFIALPIVTVARLPRGRSVEG